MSRDDVFQQFQAKQKESDEKEQRALAKESSLALGEDTRFFFKEFNIKFKEAQVKWTAWKKANVPRALLFHKPLLHHPLLCQCSPMIPSFKLSPCPPAYPHLHLSASN